MNHKAACIHFEECGGCSLQHLPATEYYQFKTEILGKILQRLGCEPEILSDIVQVPANSRRRADFKIAVNKGKVALGFCQEKSNRIVDISMCAVVEPAIFQLAQNIKTLLANFKKVGNFNGVNITHIDGIFDIYFQVKSAIHPSDKEQIINFAKQHNLARIGEKIANDELKIFYNSSPVIITFANAEIELPAGAFLQATKTAQIAITEFVLKHVSGAKNVVDLYSGCGTYSFPLAESGYRVDAFEGDYEMTLALNAAARKNGLEEKLQAQSRDLYKKPLRADELKHYDAVVINPPRNGSLPQCQQIAKSGVKKILMVSCNPATFERDARCLLDSGYNLNEIVPIDQFLWSKHLELVAYFEK